MRVTVQSPVCPRCRTPVPVEQGLWTLDSPYLCPGCDSELLVAVFPAQFQGPAKGERAQNVILDGEASCFFHPGKRAELPCLKCGRFLCALCAIELNGQHYCPNCLETGQKKGKIAELQNRGTRYDSIAFALGLASAMPFCWVASPFLSIASLYYVIRHWKSPLGIIPRTKIRFVLGAILAVIGQGVGLFLWISMIKS
ncbi:MAG: hypothetical protein WCO56_12785 [Verrucomicrobiota bacterium]